MPNKPQIGYVVAKKDFDEGDEILIKLLSPKVDVVVVSLGSRVDIKDILDKTKKCKIIYNNATCNDSTFEALEVSKTLEEQGKRVINSSHSYYYEEDKWMFYLKCLEHNLPTPETHLISKGAVYNEKRIKELLKGGPVILKAIFSERGKCVFKADNYKEFGQHIKDIVSKNYLSPIIAQRYIPNSNRSYRVTLINNKVRQSVAKIGRSWKQTGIRYDIIRLVKLPQEVKAICEKTSKVLGMNVCGLDLVENKGRWYLIEANSCPGWDFIARDEKKLLTHLANYLISFVKKN